MNAALPATALLSTVRELHSLLGAWAVAAFLPMPALVAINPTGSTDVSCLYLGLANAWLVTEFHRSCGLPHSSASWLTRTLALFTALSLNVALFVTFGLASGVTTHFPFPLMAALSTIPALGIVPWILRRLPQHPYAAIVLGGFLVFACKLAACVTARIVYGPNYIAQGYVSADWHTAKLMISLLWFLSTALSLGLLLADYKSCTGRVQTRTD